MPKDKVTEDKVSTVVQPDLCVVCDLSKIDKHSCIGAPDLVVEILSPGNSKREMKDKFELYEEAGVSEYWVVDPIHKNVLSYVLEDKKFVGVLPPFTDEDQLTSSVLDGLTINLSEVFSTSEDNY